MSSRHRSKDQRKARVREIPSVSEVLKYPLVQELLSSQNRSFVVACIRHVLDGVRERALMGDSADISVSTLSCMIVAENESMRRPSFRRVINATGVILHTGLGRALLSDKAVESLKMAAQNYCNLELDLASGRRGTRQVHVEQLICMLTGGESALVVNNNAAAVLLCLHTMASGKEVLVSRGELIEIGGSFRLPDIMEKSGCIVVEVGTTNRTTITDYRSRIRENTGLILKVHTSNYRIVGFTERASLRELVELGHENGIPVMYDLGSGALVPLDSEPVAESALSEGVDVISFSADKLLGGPQAGVIVGKKRWVEPMKKDSFARVMRVCKLTLAAMQVTLLEYLSSKDVFQVNPTLRLISKPLSEIEKSASGLMGKLKRACGDALEIEMINGESMIGGGSFPDRGLPTKLLSIVSPVHSAEELARGLRLGDPPVIGRVEGDRLLLDVRTVRENELGEIVSSLSRVVNE